MYQKNLDSLLKALKDAHHNNAFLMGFISSSLATIGLATNSQTTILGSMLLSPIGALISKNILYSFFNSINYKLDIKYKKWFLQIVMVLLITLLVSYLIGIFFQKFQNPFSQDKESVTKNWPTEQMLERADPINAFYMIFIALLCGIALPITLLQNSGVKLVAIGIATALIPPIANIGLALSLKKETIKNKKYKKNAIKTGLSIFIINCLLLWIPSKFILKEIVKDNNFFQLIENIFIFPQILLNLKKYKKFIKLDKKHDGLLDYNEFQNFKNRKTKKEFKKLDKNNSKNLTMREFLKIYK